MKREKKTMDGNQAAAHVAYAYSEVAAIYPITPSSTMAELTDEWATEGRKNIFGQTVKVTEMQSEAGAAGAVHGSLIAGALTTTFTASQGLLLMIPNLYKIAGELLPGVFHVAARTIATHALSIFGDHSDIYACRQTGVAMLASSSVQEVMDLTPIAHLTAIKGKIPFLNFFDGFRTSHEMQKIEVWDYEDLKELADMDAIASFRKNALNPNRAKLMGSAQNPDIFFQAREACNSYYNALPELVEQYMEKINERLGTNYGLFNYYGNEEAEHIIIAMGSVCQTIEETVDFLNTQGQKTGVVKVHLYRPFSAKHLLQVIPKTVKQISVLDRTKEPGAMGEPLYLDVIAALRDSAYHDIPIFSGRYGLSSKDTTPNQIYAVFVNAQKKRFTIGIEDDVTHLSLDSKEEIHIGPSEVISCKFWGLGGDGTISANKNSIKIIGNHTDRYVQAYFDYDSKKSRGLTISHLRFGHSPIKSAYLIKKADFVACHNATYIYKYDMVRDVKKDGIFLLNCPWNQEELEKELPGKVKRYLFKNQIRFYTIDAVKIGKEIGLNSKISTILQSAFFHLANIIPPKEANRLMKDAAEVSYRKKGEKIVQMNFEAIEKGALGIAEVDIPKEWEYAGDDKKDVSDIEDREEVMKFVKEIQRVVNSQEGNSLPVSAFMDYADGSTPSGTAAHERRNVAVDVPVWHPENCIQCNCCSYVCPHAVIRPAVLSEEEKENAPKDMITIPMTGMPEYEFAIVISDVDCTGCGSCAAVCPGKKGEKALTMCPIQEHTEKQTYFDYAKTLPEKKEAIVKFKENTVKGSQLKQPMLEFSGACAGCGETAYAKLVTQLFGDRMYIANATGCTSIWGNSSPSTPYTANGLGQGPAWANSLFEDAAEFGYGMSMAQKAIRGRLKEKVEELMKETQNVDLGVACKEWISTYQSGRENGSATDKLIEELQEDKNNLCQEILEEKEFLSKKSQWIFGGDGWAYDIGFGGLDHVLASGQDINIMVFDTEIYSNTGGQASKATPAGSIAKFTSGGKEKKKKDLASIAMSYGYVYVAQIAMGADYNQTVKAISEAESYDGPSLIIAYAPCISHGIKAGMGTTPHEEAKAVESGYWHLFRYNPALKGSGTSPFSLDSKEPSLAYREFLEGETRYYALRRLHPEKAAELFAKATQDARERTEYLQKLEYLYSEKQSPDTLLL